MSSQREGGFSVIETLIAIAVVAFGLVSVAGISAYVSRANSTSNSLNVLAAAAQDQVDRLRTASWTPATENPMITVGGYLSSSHTSSYASSDTRTASPSANTYTASPAATYVYALDAQNPHHATASNSPIGDLDISWQVRQGATADL